MIHTPRSWKLILLMSVATTLLAASACGGSTNNTGTITTAGTKPTTTAQPASPNTTPRAPNPSNTTLPATSRSARNTTLTSPKPQANAHFGYAVAMGDVNGDGKADAIVGAPGVQAGESDSGTADQGRVYVFSGADGSLLHTLTAPNSPPNVQFGYAVATGDVKGDGKADIIVGAPGETVSGNNSQGSVYVFSGADSSLLYTLTTPNPQSLADFGDSVATGDVNGDGKVDIIVGSANEKVGGNIAQGRVYVFSGVDGSLLRALNTPNPETQAYFGSTVATGDVNGDGKADIIVGSPHDTEDASQGHVYVFSGADGSLLRTLTPRTRGRMPPLLPL